MSSPDGVADVDAAVVAGQPPPSRHTPLSEQIVLDAALVFIDSHGLPGLTMQRLGQMLGVEAMALNRHVAGKDELLDGVVNRLVASMGGNDDVIDAPRAGWQDFLQRLAHGVRRVALSHPKAFPLVASRPPDGPWLRPPLRRLDWVETFLSGLRAEGFSDDATVAAYRAFTSFLLGHLLLEVPVHGADVSPLDVLGGTSVEDCPELNGSSRLRATTRPCRECARGRPRSATALRGDGLSRLRTSPGGRARGDPHRAAAIGWSRREDRLRTVD